MHVFTSMVAAGSAAIATTAYDISIYSCFGHGSPRYVGLIALRDVRFLSWYDRSLACTAHLLFVKPVLTCF